VGLTKPESEKSCWSTLFLTQPIPIPISICIAN